MIPLSLLLMLAQAPAPSTVPSLGLRVGCTADAMAVARAGSLAATEMGRWTCYAINKTTTTLTLSRAEFALEFMELRQLDQADVADVFNQKQKMTKAAKFARMAEFIGIAALIATGQNYWKPAAEVVKALGVGTYGATKLGEYFTKQIPSTTNALANLLVADVVLKPGQSIQWKVYASKIHNASSLGPRILAGVQ